MYIAEKGMRELYALAREATLDELAVCLQEGEEEGGSHTNPF